MGSNKFGLRSACLCLTLSVSMLYSSSIFAFPVEVSEAPTSNLALTIGAIQSAKKSIQLNIYEMSSKDIASALLAKIQSGVHVDILVEGDPVGGMSAPGKQIKTQLADAMKKIANGDHLYEMTKRAGGQRRYRFDHAKYIIVDGTNLLIGSENYSPTGNPVPGTKGNRGWEVFIHNASVAKRFAGIFKQDTDMSNGDLIEWTGRSNPNANDGEGEGDGEGGDEDSTPTRIDLAPPRTTLNATDIAEAIAPDTSESGLIKMLGDATTSIDLELMTFDSNWGGVGKTSPLYTAVLAAARRGVRVRALLNDETVFYKPKPAGSSASFNLAEMAENMDFSLLQQLANFTDGFGEEAKKEPTNLKTVRLLNSLGTKERLNLSARIVNVKAIGIGYIHNKGALIDDDKTLISSINWNENSVEHNRETGVILSSKEINAHYKALYEGDWKASASQTASTLEF